MPAWLCGGIQRGCLRGERRGCKTCFAPRYSWQDCESSLPLDAGERSRGVVMPSPMVITPANPRRQLRKAGAKAPIPDVKERRRPSHEPSWPIRPRDGVQFCGREGGDRGGWGGTWDGTRDWCGVIQEACSLLTFSRPLLPANGDTQRKKHDKSPQGPSEIQQMRSGCFGLDPILLLRPLHPIRQAMPSSRPLQGQKKGPEERHHWLFTSQC